MGATYDGSGVNFSVFSEVAEQVELCFFDDANQETRVALPERSGYTWHGYFPNMQPGQRYGYRIYGPWNPARGQRCNPAKLLISPYTKAIEGQVNWNPAVFPYKFGSPDEIESTDSAPFVPRCVVVNPFFDWRNERRPNVPLHDLIIYETHVKGFTMRHPDIPPELRGTYAGLAHPVAIEYFTKLGVTAIELMPIHQFVHDNCLVERGLRNYWGYNSIGFFAPHNEYASLGQRGQQVQEFRQMVLRLHQAGIEVILDVVYNHTAEGNHLGPMLSMKGLDNAAYYRLVPDDNRYYMDYTGTGNTLNMQHPDILLLVMDSLRYWVQEMHVDGFRFDLAAALARALHDVDRLSAFLDIIHQDPIIGQVKLIAEPWDVGEGGYQVGRFPVRWSEWNGRYRDSIRDYWRGKEQALGELGARITGSSDLYEGTGRRPHASVNFITAHDGFTLRDLVSYEKKHNEANGNGNSDGTDDNRSWNCTAEGPTDNPKILELRAKQQRNILTTLLLSQGIPMILGGDEIGRTQQGNNNAYCQDNEISWYDWEHADVDLLEFTRQLVQLRKAHPTFRRWKWFKGKLWDGTRDISWHKPDGVEMTNDDWQTWFAKAIQIFVSGNLHALDPVGQSVLDDDFHILFNASTERLEFTLPTDHGQGPWECIIDTAGASKGKVIDGRHNKVCVAPHSLIVLRHERSNLQNRTVV